MLMTANPLADAELHADAEQARADESEAIYTRLCESMHSALMSGDAAAIVETPAWGAKREHSHVFEAVIELAQYRANEFIERDLFKLAAAAMKSSDPALKAAATAWANGVAIAHADMHIDDAGAP